MNRIFNRLPRKNHRHHERLSSKDIADNRRSPSSDTKHHIHKDSSTWNNGNAAADIMFNGKNEEVVTSYYPSDMTVAWDELKLSNETHFRRTTVKKVNLSEHTLDSFYDNFLSDDAEFSLAAFHEQIGDTIKEISPWNLAQKGFHRFRCIDLDHPVAGFGKANTTKYQHCRLFDTLGLVIDSHIVSKGLPTLDCFYVEERILVEAVEGGGGGAISYVSMCLD